MRVLHFYKSYYPDSIGGVEKVISEISRISSRHGVSSDVLSLTSDKDPRVIEYQNHTVHRARQTLHIASTGLSTSVFSKFRDLAATADIVHYHYPWPMMDLVHFATGCDKPNIVTYHSDIVKQRALMPLYAPLQKRFLAQTDRIIATSQQYADSSKTLQTFRDKVDVIPIGLEAAAYPQPNQARLQKWNDRFGNTFFVFVGVLRYYKGLDTLVDAAANVGAPIVIVGGGPLEKHLKRKAEKLKLSNLHFLGVLSEEDKVALMKLARGVVMPSNLRSEAFGVSLLEGAMFGKPMITAQLNTGTQHVNKDGLTGLVVPPNAPQALAAAMNRLADDQALANRLGQNAAKRFIELFSGELMAKRYHKVYESLL